MTDLNKWKVEITGKAEKQREKLPVKIGVMFELLIAQLKRHGPEATE